MIKLNLFIDAITTHFYIYLGVKLPFKYGTDIVFIKKPNLIKLILNPFNETFSSFYLSSFFICLLQIAASKSIVYINDQYRH